MIKTNFSNCLFFAFLTVYSIFAMQENGYQYAIRVQKMTSDIQDSFKIKITQNSNVSVVPSKRTCSFVADFTTQTIKEEQGMFAPFQFTTQPINFSQPDFFLWNIPDFGLLKVVRNSVCFGHDEESSLAHHDLIFDSSEKLFLQFLKAKTLTIKSSESELCGAAIPEKLFAHHKVYNKAGLKTSSLMGNGTLVNEGIVELCYQS